MSSAVRFPYGRLTKLQNDVNALKKQVFTNTNTLGNINVSGQDITVGTLTALTIYYNDTSGTKVMLANIIANLPSTLNFSSQSKTFQSLSYKDSTTTLSVNVNDKFTEVSGKVSTNTTDISTLNGTVGTHTTQITAQGTTLTNLINSLITAGILGSGALVGLGTGVVTLAATYLPLSGGTLTGPVTMNGAVTMNSTLTMNGDLTVSAGKNFSAPSIIGGTLYARGQTIGTIQLQNDMTSYQDGSGLIIEQLNLNSYIRNQHNGSLYLGTNGNTRFTINNVGNITTTGSFNNISQTQFTYLTTLDGDIRALFSGKQATGTCITLGGAQTLTADVTTAVDTYKFFGAKPSEIAYLSTVSSNIQTQLNGKCGTGGCTTSSFVLNGAGQNSGMYFSYGYGTYFSLATRVNTGYASIITTGPNDLYIGTNNIGVIAINGTTGNVTTTNNFNGVTPTQFGYLSTLSGNVQTQLSGKASATGCQTSTFTLDGNGTDVTLNMSYKSGTDSNLFLKATSNSGALGGFLGTTGSFPLTLQTNSTQRLLIDGPGNVSINGPTTFYDVITANKGITLPLLTSTNSPFVNQLGSTVVSPTFAANTINALSAQVTNKDLLFNVVNNPITLPPGVWMLYAQVTYSWSDNTSILSTTLNFSISTSSTTIDNNCKETYYGVTVTGLNKETRRLNHMVTVLNTSQNYYLTGTINAIGTWNIYLDQSYLRAVRIA